MRIFIKILRVGFFCLVTTFFLLLTPNIVLANTCTGSVDYTYKTYECLIDDFTGGRYCSSAKTESATSTCSYRQFPNGTWICGRCSRVDEECLYNPLCNVVRPLGDICGRGSIWTTNNCNGCVTVDGNCNSEDYPNGVCTYANITKKCDAGTLSTIDSVGTDGYFNWKCLGNSCSDSTDATCQVRRIAPVAGAAGQCNSTAISTSYCDYASIPTKCAVGTATLVNDNLTDGIDWTCSGTTTGEVCGGGVGAMVNCGTSKIAPVTRVDGACSGINGTVVQSIPSTGLCNSGTASPIPVNTSGTTYSWNCYGTNGVCPASTANNPACSAIQDTAPNLSSAVLKNTSGTVIAVETGGRNHSCDTTFAGSKTNVWTITASDANGVADIKETSIRFRSATNTYTYGPTATSGGVANFTVDTASFNPGTYNVEVLIDDIHSPTPSNRGWLDTLRDFKIWDCNVIVDGTLYDNSANLGCSNSNNDGFTTPIPTGIDSFTFAYGDLTDSSTRNMTVVSPNFDSPDYLTWQNNYFLVYDDFLGVFRSLKVNDTCVSWNSHLSPSTYVNAYDSNPTINLKYSAIMDQEAWYRVLNGGVFSKTNITNYVPVTCVSNCNTSSNGLIWSKDIDLSSSDVGITAIAAIKRPISYGYEELKYSIYGGKGVGTTITTTGTTVLWSEIKDNPATNKGVIFVDRDLTIDSNMTPSEPTLLVVKGDIIINNNVTQITGMLFADNTIGASGENEVQLKITGALYGKDGVTLNRSYVTKRTNNTIPAVEITYDPNLIFNLDSKLWYIYDNWRLE